jgi:hypothetical protein
VQRVTDGHRFRDREELLAAQAEDPSSLVLWHVLDVENNARHRDLLDISVLYPGGAIASDAMPWTLPDGLSLYRRCLAAAGGRHLAPALGRLTFTRFLRQWVRSADGLAAGRHRQMHADPGADLGGEHARHAPPRAGCAGRRCRYRGVRLRDADRPADFTAMNRPAEGVKHLWSSGQP